MLQNIKISNLRKKTNYTRRLTLYIFFWSVSLLGLSIFSYDRLAKYSTDELGEKAVILAKDIAERFNIKSDDVNTLRKLSFDELSREPVNIDFQKKANKVMNNSDIKKIYIEVPVPKSKLKYKVETGELNVYDKAPIGTYLNNYYLLDASLGEDHRMRKYTKDKERYKIRSDKFEMAYDRRETIYTAIDRWGGDITGYAPFYDDKGNYIGLVGVDISIKKYEKSVKKYTHIMAGFIFMNIFIGMLSIHLVIKIKNAEKQIRYKTILSSIDDLTSVLNRRGFEELFREEWSKSIKYKKSISLLIIDADKFKEFNDNYGHLQGDKLLIKIADILKKNAEKYGGIAGRYGGDEFIILIPGTDYDESEKVAKEIIEDVARLNIKNEYSKSQSKQTVSIGVSSIIPQEGMTLATLIEKADNALYKSKKQGRNSVNVWK